MPIRSAQVTDLARIDELYSQGMQLALQGEGATHPIRLWQMLTRTLSSLLPLSTPSEMLYVLEDDRGRVMGFIQGELLGGSELPAPRRRDPDAIRVLNFTLAPELSGAAGGALIDHLCSEAVARGVGRVYVRIPEGHQAVESFKAHGFQRYASDRVFFRDDLLEVADQPDLAGLRPARKKDLLGLFTLYLAVTPKQVSQLEAPDFDQWRAVHDESDRFWPFGRRAVRSMVVERGGEVMGWLGIEPGPPGRPHRIALLARGESRADGELLEGLLHQAIRTFSTHPGPVWCNVRNYDTTTTRVLQDAGFELLAGQELLVREMRARVAARAKPKREKALAPVFGATVR